MHSCTTFEFPLIFHMNVCITFCILSLWCCKQVHVCSKVHCWKMKGFFSIHFEVKQEVNGFGIVAH